MPDVYATIAEADGELQERLAETLELRAADPAQRAMFVAYTSALTLPDGAAVLEVGCGTGAITRQLTRLPGVASVTGIDPSPFFVARAKELGDGLPIAFDLGDARDLDLPSEAFDAVIFHTALCHVPDCELALDEAHRVLRPGGRLAVFDGDYATMTMARNERDPLQSCADAVLSMLVHDPWLMRSTTTASPTSTSAGTATRRPAARSTSSRSSTGARRRSWPTGRSGRSSARR